MLVLIAVLLALIPAAAILYPFIFRRGLSIRLPRRDLHLLGADPPVGSRHRRTQEHRVGARHRQPDAEDDYRELREQYMLEAANIMKAMELEDQQEEELLANVASEVKAVRERITGSSQEDDEPTNDE